MIMKMSKENYERLTNWYNFLVETADDAVAEYFIDWLTMGADFGRKYLNPGNDNNPGGEA